METPAEKISECSLRYVRATQQLGAASQFQATENTEEKGSA